VSKRANALAERIEQGAEALAGLAEGLSEAEWQRVVPNEERTVAALVHHVAGACPILVDWARGLADGKPLTGVTWEAIAQMNAQHAQEYAAAGKQETLELLRANGTVAADRVREFTDEDLDNVATVCLNWDAPQSAQTFIELYCVGHSYNHLASIRAFLNGNA